MTEERQDKPVRSFSRYSPSTLEDLGPRSSPQAEPSLAEVTARALNSYPDAAPKATPAPVSGGWDQPPPPEPSQFWQDERNGRAAKAPEIAPPQPEARDLPKTPPSADEPEPLARTGPAHEIDTDAASEPETRTPGETEPKPAPVFMRVASQAAQAIRETAGPALMKSAFWLAHNLRRREIRKRYNRLLVLGHTRFADRYLEQLFFLSTRQTETIDPAPERGIHYDGPVPGAAFNWVMSQMPQDLRQFVFVDVRAERGRAALLASRYGFSRIVAYEWDAARLDDLEMNVAQYPRSRMTCRRVDCHRADLLGVTLPNQPCVVWFSAAWREPLIGEVMTLLRESYRQNPRRIYVVLENADAETGIGLDTIFDAIEPPLAERLKLKLLSPVDFKVYRSSY
jgi:hypothetical protein